MTHEPLPAGQLTIEALQRKYEDLNRKKIEAETRQHLAGEKLKQLRAEALANWGTDDLDALRRKLVQMQEENEQRRAKYQSDLESIESKLQSIEGQYQERRP